MNRRTAPAFGLPLLSLLLSIACGCAPPNPFFEIHNVAALGPDERVVIGIIRYMNGDIRALVPEKYITSRPRFSYDLHWVATPRSETSGMPLRLSPEGGVFAVKVKRKPVYLESIVAETRAGNIFVNATFPLYLRLPVTGDNCVFVGEIVVSAKGERPSTWHWTEESVEAKVLDTYDRDGDALSMYVKGCDLKKALAEHPSKDELDVLLAPVRAEQRTEEQRKATEQLIH
jgi:hypothetical protein